MPEQRLSVGRLAITMARRSVFSDRSAIPSTTPPGPVRGGARQPASNKHRDAQAGHARSESSARHAQTCVKPSTDAGGALNCRHSFRVDARRSPVRLRGDTLKSHLTPSGPHPLRVTQTRRQRHPGRPPRSVRPQLSALAGMDEVLAKPVKEARRQPSTRTPGTWRPPGESTAQRRPRRGAGARKRGPTRDGIRGAQR